MKKLKINEKSNKSIFEQIVEYIETLILSQELKEGEFIPSVREFAVQNSINPNTVAKAYQELQRKEFITPIRGCGLQVSVLKESFISKRKNQIILSHIEELKMKAKDLGVSQADLLKLIQENL